MTKQQVRISKFLSLVLRHDPGAASLKLDEAGWVPVDELIVACGRVGIKISREELDAVVAENDKKRFAYSLDGNRIRANQGHSVAVELGLAALVPPDVLYHGTARQNLPSIKANGLNPGKRQQVHLSDDSETAYRVGQRHGSPVVLKIAAGRMGQDGHIFYLSENGVWLTADVPPNYLEGEG